MGHDRCITHKQAAGVLLFPSAPFPRTLKMICREVSNRHGTVIGLRGGSFSPEHPEHRSPEFALSNTHKGNESDGIMPLH